MTWLKALNFGLLQWVGVRLQREVSDGSPGEPAAGATMAYSLIGPILPLTGWWSSYVGHRGDLVRWELPR